NFSKPVHTLFTHGGGKWGILNTSAGERAESSAGSTPIIFLFLFYPFLNKRKRPALDPPLRRQGVFPSAGPRRKMQKTAGSEGSGRQMRFVKNLSKSVQDSFTICRRRCGILILPEGKTPARRHPFSICFLSFTFS